MHHDFLGGGEAVVCCRGHVVICRSGGEQNARLERFHGEAVDDVSAGPRRTHPVVTDRGQRRADFRHVIEQGHWLAIQSRLA